MLLIEKVAGIQKAVRRGGSAMDKYLAKVMTKQKMGGVAARGEKQTKAISEAIKRWAKKLEARKTMGL